MKAIRDQAQAILHYSKQREYSLDVQQDAAEIKLRAERRLGELLPHGKRGTKFHDEICTPVQRHRYHRIASLDKPTFEGHIRQARASKREITTAGAIKLAKVIKVKKREASAGPETVDDLDKLIKSGRKFGTIYADPPWQYSNQATRSATNGEYGTMPVDEIAALPIGELAADVCHLHLWTTNAFLFETQKIFEAWGFEYKSAFVWVKPQMGIGNYWRVSHEFLLLGIKGRAPFQDHGLMSWASLDRIGHSVKPEAIRRMVEKAGVGPRLELFGRQPLDGWTVWGRGMFPSMFDHDVKAI